MSRGSVEQAQQPDHRVDAARPGASLTAMPDGAPPAGGREVARRRLQQQLGDRGRVQDQAEAQRRARRRLASVKWPVTGRSTDATRYCPARYSYTRSPSAIRFAPCAMSASTVPDIDGVGGVGCSTFEIRTPSMAVVMSGRAWRASSVRSSSRSMAPIEAPIPILAAKREDQCK